MVIINKEMLPEGHPSIIACEVCNQSVHNQAKNKKYRCYVCKKQVEGYRRLRKPTYTDRRKKAKIRPKDMISKAELIMYLDKLDSGTATRDKAFISLLYVTAARVEEVLGRIHDYKRSRISPPLKKGQILFQTFQGQEFMIVYRIPILKLREEAVRNVPIAVKNEEPFINHIRKHLKDLDMDDFIFSFTRQHAWRISQRIGQNNHYFRHLRLTHLAEEYNYNPLDLQQFVGWSSMEMAARYTHFNWQTLAKKML